jgi:hypothetical protein
MNIIYFALIFIVTRMLLDLFLDICVGKLGRNLNMDTVKECGVMFDFAVFAYFYGFKLN